MLLLLLLLRLVMLLHSSTYWCGVHAAFATNVFNTYVTRIAKVSVDKLLDLTGILFVFFFVYIRLKNVIYLVPVQPDDNGFV